MTIGIIAKGILLVAFLSVLLSTILYLLDTRKANAQLEKLAHTAYIFKTLLVGVASAILIYLTVNHQFQYYYVYNYTSTDLAFRYLVSAFYGGQEGSFMLWILLSGLVGMGLIRWTDSTYRSPVMAVMGITQVFLLSMILGVDVFGIHIGASPFRTLAEAMPDAPFLKANPDFIPVDGRGLNDLLKSPWMMIHPPILFLGFSMMTVPYAFAMASLIKGKYQEWTKPSLPWILAANLCLLTAIFLGGYWAYVTLSFGGYWAWDPVENASFVPWLFGVAGIHTMLIQRKHASAQRSSIFFAILSYIAIVYETFLTRSGILGDASVHSFVDLGLYTQLVVFMAVIALGGIGMYLYRLSDLPKPTTSSSWLSREVWVFWGSMVTMLSGLIIILGTSSPIIGRIFQDNPTPPQIEFYNDWTLPLAIIMAFMTVLAQYLWWKKQDSESLAKDLIPVVGISALVSVLFIIIGDIRTFKYMILLLSGNFAVIGNAFVLTRLVKKNPTLIGGTLTHVGFGLLIVGILASSAYNSFLLDDDTKAYNAAVRAGQVKDKQGIPVLKEVTMIELKKGEPKILNSEFRVTYNGFNVGNENRPGEQFYEIEVEPLSGGQFTLFPVVYPMIQSSTAEQINWSVDPDVYTGINYDLYLYVAGSSFVEQENERVASSARFQPASDVTPSENGLTELQFTQGKAHSLGDYTITFNGFEQIPEQEKPANSFIAVRANLHFHNSQNGDHFDATPLFSIIEENGSKITQSPVFSAPNGIEVIFSNVVPMSDEITVQIAGIQGSIIEGDWVLLIAEKKPFVSVVWLGTFVIMAGFSVSIMRRWNDIRRGKKTSLA